MRERSYVLRGEVSVVRPNHRRENVSLISTVTNRGTARWMVLHKVINAVLLITFLQRLTGDAGRKVSLILDNLKVHHAPPVAVWLAEHRDRIEVFYLPSYSLELELNPGELLNTNLKEAITKKAPTHHKGELKRPIIDHLRRISKLPGRVKKYFQHPLVKYAA